MIPQQLLYILVGALFSAIATLVLSTHQEYKQSERTRRALYSEMESMEDLLENIAEEERENRAVRIQIEHQISTKMYDQHLPNLGRLTDSEIADVMEFYRRMNYLVDSYQTYNQYQEANTPEDKEEMKKHRSEEWFSSYHVGLTAGKALDDLESAREAREDFNFIRYVLRRWVG